MRGASAIALLLLVACGGTDAVADAGRDAGGACVESEQPEPGDPCIPNRCGNSRGVGMTCTAGGRQCMRNGFDNAFLCTLDFEPEASLNICTLTCVEDEDCGEGAVCVGDPDNPTAGRGCVPAACAPSRPDAGMPLDAAAQDGGSTDAAAEDGAVASG